jgi:NADH-quinone oxidoreductase subunit M
MPGTANFVGELLVLFGTFEDKLTWGLVAAAGVALASVYTIRLFIRAMHNRTGDGVQSSEICALELGVIAPVAAVIVVLGVYPQVILEGTEKATTRAVAATQPEVSTTAEVQGIPEEPGQP